MEHTLTLEIPEQTYASLLKTAKRKGRSPEDLAAQWIVEATRTLADDPIEQFIGLFSSSVPDWADAHDRYLG